MKKSFSFLIFFSFSSNKALNIVFVKFLWKWFEKWWECCEGLEHECLIKVKTKMEQEMLLQNSRKVLTVSKFPFPRLKKFLKLVFSNWKNPTSFHHFPLWNVFLPLSLRVEWKGESLSQMFFILSSVPEKKSQLKMKMLMRWNL